MCGSMRRSARTAAPDRAVPVVTASLAAGNRLGNRGIGPVRGRVRCDEACDAHAELGELGQLSATAPVRAGVQATLVLQPTRKDVSRLRFTRAQRRAGRARVLLWLVISDALGNTRIVRQRLLMKI